MAPGAGRTTPRLLAVARAGAARGAPLPNGRWLAGTARGGAQRSLARRPRNRRGGSSAQARAPRELRPGVATGRGIRRQNPAQAQAQAGIAAPQRDDADKKPPDRDEERGHLHRESVAIGSVTVAKNVEA